MADVLAGKVAIVTGAAGGIGRAYARALAEAGAAVALADLNETAADKVAAALRADGLRALGVGVDITSEESAVAMAERTVSELGGIDILVNNAALMQEIPRQPWLELPIDWIDRTMHVNVYGALICTRACVPSMIDRGGGKIVNQSSAVVFDNYAGPYSISKLALTGLTYGLARELGKHNIAVNAIAPGTIKTPASLNLHAEGTEFWDRSEARAAMRGAGMPEDLCGALVFLASPASDYMTGQCLNVDGGWIMRL